MVGIKDWSSFTIKSLGSTLLPMNRVTSLNISYWRNILLLGLTFPSICLWTQLDLLALARVFIWSTSLEFTSVTPGWVLYPPRKYKWMTIYMLGIKGSIMKKNLVLAKYLILNERRSILIIMRLSVRLAKSRRKTSLVRNQGELFLKCNLYVIDNMGWF